jgi:alanine racemase
MLSTENLLHNLAVVRAKAPKAKIMAMIKANAYGHGLRSVGQRLDEHVDALGVASIDEAMALRQAGVLAPIVLIEGVFSADELQHASEQGFHVVFNNPCQLQWLNDSPPLKPIIAWVKVDTGMGRLGFSLEDTPLALQKLSESVSIQNPIGLLSHFACADEPNHPLNQKQIAAFSSISQQHQGPKSLCNSAGIFSFPTHHYDWIRPGIALFGASPLVGCSAQALGLKPVMTMHTRLISVKMLRSGSSVGYGARYTCPEDMRVGVIAMGYGDGFPRTASDGTPVLVNGVRCPVVGRVSMDMTTIDLRPCPEAKIGTAVVLWGDGLAVEDVALTTHHINYDLLTGVQNRVRFHWN